MDNYQVQTPMRQRKKPVRKKPKFKFNVNINWNKKYVLGIFGAAVVATSSFLIYGAFQDGKQSKPTVVIAEASPSPKVSIKPSKQPEESKKPTIVENVTMSFVGDVIFAGRVKDRLITEGYEYPYKQIQSALDADITIANMETPVTTKGTAAYKEYTYQSTPLALPAFRKAGFDLVTLANNHVLDYGVDALLDTFEELSKNDIAYVGAGRTEDEAYRPYYMEQNGMRIAFIGLSHVVPEASWKALNPSSIYPDGLPGIANMYELTKPIAMIKQAKKNADLVVVLPHWGIERQVTPSEKQTLMAHELIDAGADLIVGSHPHVVQSIEKYKGKWIAYSLGNFLFTTSTTAETWRTTVLKATCSTNGACSIGLTPANNDGLIPRPMSTEQKIDFLQHLDQISPTVKIDQNGKVRGE